MNPNRDERLHIAAHERRRILVATLLNASVEISLDELVARVEVAETDGGEQVAPERVHVDLVHFHLPFLQRAGLIEWDRDRRVVEPTERLERAAADLSERLLDG